MSDAIREPQFRGFLDPRVKEAAVAIGRSGGWHMSSGYRLPCPQTRTHNLGIALDVAPITYTRGGFWLNTAATILDYVQRNVSHQNWMAIAEADHVHLALSNRPAIGYNLKGVTHAFDPITKEPFGVSLGKDTKGRPIMSLSLQDNAYGDVLHGDLVLSSGDVGMGDIGMGDLMLSAGDASTVDSRLIELAESGDATRAQKALNAISRVAEGPKRGLGHIHAKKAAERHVTVPYYLVSKGATVRASNVGKQNRMSVAEANIIREDLLLVPQNDAPAPTDVPRVGADFVLDLTTDVAARYGLGNDLPCRYVGSIIVITANALKNVPDISATVTIQIGTRVINAKATSIFATVQLSPEGKSTRIYMPIAVLAAARARLIRPSIITGTGLSAAEICKLVVSGLPADYTVTHSFMAAEDALTNEFVRLLP